MCERWVPFSRNLASNALLLRVRRQRKPWQLLRAKCEGWLRDVLSLGGFSTPVQASSPFQWEWWPPNSASASVWQRESGEKEKALSPSRKHPFLRPRGCYGASFKIWLLWFQSKENLRLAIGLGRNMRSHKPGVYQQNTAMDPLHNSYY